MPKKNRDETKYLLDETVRGTLRAWREGVTVPLRYKPEIWQERVKRTLIVAAVLSNPLLMAACAGAVAWSFWRRRGLAAAMIRLNRLKPLTFSAIPRAPHWTTDVAKEVARLEATFTPFSKYFSSGAFLVGSTAVPEIRMGKPLHDIAFAMRADCAPQALVSVLGDLGYFVIGDSPHAPEGGDCWAINLPYGADDPRGGFTVHLMGPSAYPWLHSQINLAAYFRCHPAACEEYAAAKEMASGPGVSTRDYSIAKDAVIVRLLNASKRWAEETGRSHIDFGKLFPFGASGPCQQA